MKKLVSNGRNGHYFGVNTLFPLAESDFQSSEN